MLFGIAEKRSPRYGVSPTPHPETQTGSLCFLKKTKAHKEVQAPRTGQKLGWARAPHDVAVSAARAPFGQAKCGTRGKLTASFTPRARRHWCPRAYGLLGAPGGGWSQFREGH